MAKAEHGTIVVTTLILQTRASPGKTNQYEYASAIQETNAPVKALVTVQMAKPIDASHHGKEKNAIPSKQIRSDKENWHIV